MWTDVFETSAQCRPSVRGASVLREFVIALAEPETAGGGQSDR
jgi:hypothetical protein